MLSTEASLLQALGQYNCAPQHCLTSPIHTIKTHASAHTHNTTPPYCHRPTHPRRCQEQQQGIKGHKTAKACYPVPPTAQKYTGVITACCRLLPLRLYPPSPSVTKEMDGHTLGVMLHARNTCRQSSWVASAVSCSACSYSVYATLLRVCPSNS